MNKNSKGVIHFLLLLSLALILLAGVGFYAYKSGQIKLTSTQKRAGVSLTPTAGQAPNDDLANWKTYTNDKYSFTFDYRPDLGLTEDERGIQLNHYPQQNEDYAKQFSLFLTVEGNSEQFSLEEYVEKKLCGVGRAIPAGYEWMKDLPEFCMQTFNESKRDYVVAGIQGVRGTYNPYETPTSVVLFEHEGNLYVFKLSAETGGEPTELAEATLDQILSTFKFLE